MYLDPRWYSKFINRFLEATKTSNSGNIITMDFCEFRTDYNGISSARSPAAALAATVLKILERSTDMRCIILDGRTDLEVAMLAKEQHRHSFHQVRLFSMANCQVTLPVTFFGGPDFQRLVYLDISNNKVWGRALLVESQTFTPRQLPSLRILKLRGLGLTGFTASRVLAAFGWQLWSIDLSCNNLGAGFVDDLMMFSVRCEATGRLQNEEHFQVEGKLRTSAVPVPDLYFVDESGSSAMFSHPDRYLADPPPYTAAQDSHDDNLSRTRAHVRLAGTEAIRGDSVEDTKRALDGGPFHPIPSAQGIPCDDPPRAGLTHLHLNDLNVPSRDVEKLLMHHCGSLEHFECNRGLVVYDYGTKGLPKTPWLSTSHVLYGFPGASYLFRPVFQSNLRVLKIHHSLVTNVPTLVSNGACALENLWLAETYLRERMDLAYPQTYVPDMNPRLHSLILSKVPRLSTGVVIERLVDFLKLAAVQEQSIEQTRRAITHHRAATVLRGLRHIRLEFDPDPAEELGGLGGDDDVADAMNELSLVSESAWDVSSSWVPDRSRKASSSATTALRATQPAAPASPDNNAARKHDPLPDSQQQRLSTFPFDRADGEYYFHPVDGDGGSATVPVWIGPGVIGVTGQPPAVDEYMRILASSSSSSRFAQHPTTATPCQVAAGAPAGALVFGRAWDHILVPPAARGIRKPAVAPADLRRGPGGLRDVLEALKAFRRESRTRYHAVLAREGEGAGRRAHHPLLHDYWKGRLDIDLAVAPGADSAEYWR